MFWFWCFSVQQAIGEADQCLSGCWVINVDVKVTVVEFLSSTNCMGMLWFLWNLGGNARSRAVRLGNGIMGACFQAPCATPGYKLMEAKLVYLWCTWLRSVLGYVISLHLHRMVSPEWIDCLWSMALLINTFYSLYVLFYAQSNRQEVCIWCCPLFIPRSPNPGWCVGWSLNWQFVVSYNNLPKRSFGQKKNGFKIIWVHVSRLLMPHLDRD